MSRPQGDPVQCRQSFDAAFARDDAGRAFDRAVDLNASLLEVFGQDELLGLRELADRHARLMASRSRRIERFPRPDPDPLAYEAAGSFAGQCQRLRLLAVEVCAGEGPRFRLAEREMSFAARGRGTVRIRGLTPQEQARQLRGERAQARRVETLDRKARDAATPAIGRLVNALVEHDRDCVVPPSWHADGYLPAELVGRRVVEAAAFILEYHHAAGFDRARLARWQACLTGWVGRAAARARLRSAAAAAIAPDDEAALLGLVRTDEA
ncbi:MULTISPECIES: hypothetical protein [unclassified Methylobacterium]|uniref:hypothetical protein n=1 Tax=unclassified Methylobacterium TaxID=2615210 RepID=UPI0005B9E11A|nr:MULTISPECIES: hypothetical protein [unclassified Methylobacterium]